MKNILITGATGNIGREVISYLRFYYPDDHIIAGVRNIPKAQAKLGTTPQLTYRNFDFEDPHSFEDAFLGVDILFLLRPPHISDVKTYFRPLLQKAQHAGISAIVFLSVQGAERSSVIPHNKIEQLIRELGFDYVFVRPGYFMQNLTTTLLTEIREHKRITLPSADAVFNWVDVKNIAEATAKLIGEFPAHKNQAYEITGLENKSFGEVAQLISTVTGMQVTYRPINPIRFFFLKRKELKSNGFALVMLLLHFLPRFQKAPVISDSYKKLTGKEPTSIEHFLEREKHTLFPALQ